MGSHLIAVSLFLVGVGVMPLGAAAPELSDPVAPENGSLRVVPVIPFGKTVVIPLAANDTDGDPLEFRVTSSNPKVFARVKTGNPVLRIHVEYGGDPNATPPAPAFSGDLEFQLFRDLTPITAGNIAGLAQAGFYDDLIFHRIIKDFVAQGGDPAGNGTGQTDPGDPNTFVGLPYDFEHEFRPSLIFSGRGQLAMANSNGGYDRGRSVGSGFIQLGDFSPTNGSQFFITYAQPRHLDFKHTIFGQLVRGFDVLDKMATVPRDAATDKPTIPVKMTAVSVRPGRAEATLVLSAITLGSASIKITATDPSGNEALRTFQVSCVEDTFNDPPVLRPIPNLITPIGVRPELPLRGFDLEHDYLLYGIASANGNPQPGAFGMAQIATSYSPRQTAGFQDIAVGVAGFNDPRVGAQPSGVEPFAPFEPYNFQVAEIGYGDRPVSATMQIIEGTEDLPVTAVVAEFQDADAAGQPGDFVAIVNWGDGTAEKASSETPTPSVMIERSAIRPGAFVVKATHTYARPGTYLVRVVIDAPLGATAAVSSRAIISPAAANLRAIGRDLDQSGATVNDRVVATFSDSSGVPNAQFTALINWGDGALSSGEIRRLSSGIFAVNGTHTYRDPGTFATHIYVRRTGPAPEETVAWGSVSVDGFNAVRVLPPFNMPHLVGQISTVAADPQNPNGPQKQFKTTTGTGANTVTRFTCSIVILNSGNEKSRRGSLKFYLSTDNQFNLAPITNPGQPVIPADIALRIGPFPKATIPPLAAGDGVRYNFDATETLDLRLLAPKGETGAGLTLLAVFDYKDEVADHMPIDREVPFGPINGIVVHPTALQVSEAPGSTHTGTFSVRLDRAPTAEVKIPLTVADAAELTIDKTELTFTATNWSTAQVVTVTATDDPTKESTETTQVRVGVSVSTDPRWNSMDGADVSVSITDND